jgi:hypothetical protein
MYLFFSPPPFFPIDPETVDDALENNCYTVGVPFSSTKQPGTHPHFEHAYIAYSLLSYACIRTAAVTFILYLLHNLFIVTCLATLLVILDCLE